MTCSGFGRSTLVFFTMILTAKNANSGFQLIVALGMEICNCAVFSAMFKRVLPIFIKRFVAQQQTTEAPTRLFCYNRVNYTYP